MKEEEKGFKMTYVLPAGNDGKNVYELSKFVKFFKGRSQKLLWNCTKNNKPSGLILCLNESWDLKLFIDTISWNIGKLFAKLGVKPSEAVSFSKST